MVFEDLFNDPNQMVLWGSIIAVGNPILITLIPKPPILTKLFGMDIRWLGALAGGGLAAYGLSQGGQIPFLNAPAAAYARSSYTNNIRRLAYYSAAHRSI